MRRYLLLFLILSVLASSMFLSCKKEEETKLTMSGTISFEMPSYSYVGETFTLTASGVTAPTGVTYFWTTTDTTVLADTVFSNSVTITVPKNAGQFTMVAGAKFSGYYNTYKTITTTVVDTTFGGSIKGLKRGTDSIIDPRDYNKYYITTIGNLQWFTDNLRYSGTVSNPIGAPYAQAAPLSKIFGQLYSWNDATGGVSASGLGQGPQGACPDGWSVPTREDWEDFGKVLNGGEAVSFDDLWHGLGGRVTVDATFNGSKFWPYSPDNTKANAFNWSALATGNSIDSYSRFNNLLSYGMWWSSTEVDDNLGSYRYIFYNQSYFAPHKIDKKEFGVSVRCVRLASAI